MGNVKTAGFGLSGGFIGDHLQIAQPGASWRVIAGETNHKPDRHYVDKEATLCRMKYHRLHLILASSIKIIILDKKDYFSRKSGMEFPKVGRGWGEINRIKKKGLRFLSVNPCYSW